MHLFQFIVYRATDNCSCTDPTCGSHGSILQDCASDAVSEHPVIGRFEVGVEGIELDGQFYETCHFIKVLEKTGFYPPVSKILADIQAALLDYSAELWITQIKIK